MNSVSLWRLIVLACCASLTIVAKSASAGVHQHYERRVGNEIGEMDRHETAPKWPFSGVISESGVYWNLMDSGVNSIRLGDLEHCGGASEPGIEYDKKFVYFANTVLSSQSNEAVGTYVVPWGDMAYPLMTNAGVTRKAIGQLPQQSVSNWRASRRTTHDTLQASQRYGSERTIKHKAFLGPAKIHLLHIADEDVQHYVLSYGPNADFVTNALSLDYIESGRIDDLGVHAEEYRLHQEEVARQTRENDDYDPHAGPIRFFGPRISGIGDSYVRWDMLLSGFSWCDRRQGFFLDAATGELVGCFEGELLEILPSPPVLADMWAVPLGFSSDECAGSLKVWKSDPAVWFQRLEVLRTGDLAGKGLQQ